eukprot:PITA_35747
MGGRVCAKPIGRPKTMESPCEFVELPVIDFSLLPWKSGGDAHHHDQRELEKLREACQEWGFFRAINHGVNSTLVQAVDSMVRDMFMLPADIKEKAISPILNTGYFRPQRGTEGKDSLPESMVFPNDTSVDDISSKLWPHGNHKFRERMQEYNSEMREVSHGILKLILCSLGVDVTEHYSSPLFQKSQGWLRMNFYHNKNDHDNQQQQRYSKAHTDIGCLTILYQDHVGGLQIRTKEGEWINTKPLPGSFVVNIGDCLQMWSNGRYRSAEHRVVYGGSERLSMAFFLDFTDKAEIRAPEELIDEKHPRKYRGVTFEDLKAYFMKAGPTLGGPPAYFLL